MSVVRLFFGVVFISSEFTDIYFLLKIILYCCSYPHQRCFPKN